MSTEPAIPVKRLSQLSRVALLDHFHALSTEDLRLRFGGPMTEERLAQYLAGIDLGRDALFGVFDGELRLVGVAHVARMEDGAELGVSVIPAERGKGIGNALFQRANAYARNQFLGQLFMHCLIENKVMMHIARKNGMQIVTEAGEADAYLELPPTDTATIAHEMLQERVALFDVALKAQVRGAKRMAARLRGETPQ
jgi:RimJ/RimL family protein N-acetyltransferase